MIPHSAPFIGDEEIEAVARVLRSGHIAQGPEVEAFEKECADLVGRRYGVAVSSGTAALHLALDALGPAPSDCVAVPAYACASLVTAVRMHGSKPLLCDVGPDQNIDVDTIPTDTNTAIVPHLFGAPAAFPTDLTVVEDIAQSLGGSTGRDGRIAIASFYATKLMTTGEGGMVLTDDEALADHIRDRRDYDNRDDLQNRFAYKMTDFQAAMGRVQLRRLPAFIRRRKEIAEQYEQAFQGLPLVLPQASGHVFFRYVIKIDRAGRLAEHLAADGI